MPRHKNFNQTNTVKEATNLFWKDGFYQTSIQDLVKNLGVNRASLYDTYGDKEGLFKRCFQTYRDDVFTITKEIFSTHNTTKSRFQSLFQWLITTLIEDKEKKGCLICNTYTEVLPYSKNNTLIDLVNETKALWVEIILNELKKGAQSNEIKKEINLENTAHTMYASMIGVCVLSKTHTTTERLENILNIHFQIFK